MTPNEFDKLWSELAREAAARLRMSSPSSLEEAEAQYDALVIEEKMQDSTRALQTRREPLAFPTATTAYARLAASGQSAFATNTLTRWPVSSAILHIHGANYNVLTDASGAVYLRPPPPPYHQHVLVNGKRHALRSVVGDSTLMEIVDVNLRVIENVLLETSNKLPQQSVDFE